MQLCAIQAVGVEEGRGFLLSRRGAFETEDRENIEGGIFGEV